MKKLITTFLVLFLTTNAFALDTSGLSEKQKAELALKAAEMKENTPSIVPPTPAKVNEWVQVGENIGTAIVAVAGKVGVAGDKFMESNTGKIVIGLIVFKMMGGTIIHITIGMICLIIFLSLWTYFFKKVCVYKKITIEPVSGSIFKKKTYEMVNPDQVESERIIFWLTFCAGCLVCIAIMFTG